MLDFHRELQNLLHMYQGRADIRRGAVIAFCGMRSGDGVSSVARSFATMVTGQSRKGVWLFDLDLYVNGQFSHFSHPAMVTRNGAVGPARDPGMGQVPFWHVSPALVRASGRAVQPNWYMGLHQIGQHPFFVTRFRADALRQGQRVHLTRAANYWQYLRSAIDLAVVDVPARDRARSILAVARDMDGVVLVANPQIPAHEIIRMKAEVEGAGGKCLGLVYNQRQNFVPMPGQQSGT